jgi:hypothetical protein
MAVSARPPGDSPPSGGLIGATISLSFSLEAAEPGAPLPANAVSGTCSAVDGAVLSAVDVIVDDGQGARLTYPAAFPPNGNGTWQCRPPVYHAGNTTFTVRVTGRWYDSGLGRWVSGSREAASAVGAVTLTSPTPNLFIGSAPHSPIEVPKGGTTVHFYATTNPAYGQRQITWSLDGGPEHPTRPDPTYQDPNYWAADVPIPDFPLRTFSVTIRVRQVIGGATATETRSFTTVDVTAPDLAFLHPGPEQSLVASATGGLDIVVSGTARDGQSGLDEHGVRWLPGSPSASYPSPTTSDGWANWASTVHVAGPGTYTFEVQTADNAGNTANAKRTVNVVSDYVPANLGGRLGHRAYLDALLRFAHDRLVAPTSGSQPPDEITTSLLADVLAQPLARLTQPSAGAADIGDEPVNQLRAVAEILRRAIVAGVDSQSDPDNQDKRLLAHWTFNDGTRETYQGREYYRDTYHGLAAFAAPSLVSTGGVHDEGLLLNDTDGTTSAAVTFFFLGANDADYSVAFWLDAAPTLGGGTPEWDYILHAGDSADDQTFVVRLRPDTRQLQVTVTTSVGGVKHPVTLESGRSVPGSSWLHVAVVRQGPQLKLYLDGVLDSQATLDGPLAGTAQALSIGKDPWHDGASAVLDDLRTYFGALTPAEVASLTTPPVYPTMMTGYLQAAYDTLLAAFGTNSTALRLARGDSDEARQALAETLGIPLRYSDDAPDTLDQLTLTGDSITEAKLQALFGLRDTTSASAADPLVPLAEPLLLTWRRTHLRTQWQQQDHSWPAGEQDPNREYPALVDPDLIGLADLATKPVNDTATRLWQSRRAEVDGYLRTLAAILKSDANPTQTDAFDAMLKDTWPATPSGPGIDLDDLAAQRAAGTDIRPALAALLLSPDAFEVLLRSGRLAGKDVMDNSDWQAVFAILTQVRKARRYPAWRGEEAQLSLSPDFFASNPDTPALRPWLADEAARADWEHVLNLRIRQDAESVAGFAETVRTVDRAVVPLLRDALVAELAGDRPIGEYPQVAAWLTERFLIDVTASGALVTTRVLQAVESLQTLLFLVRTRRLANNHPADKWIIKDNAVDLFDAEWAWLSKYETWRSAMLTWRYPENTLLPTLVPATPATSVEYDAYYGPNGLVASLRKIPKLTVEKARALGLAYVDAIKSHLRDIDDNLLKFLLTDRTGYDEMVTRATMSRIRPDLPFLWGFAPLLIASRLQEAGDYVAALDWYRLVHAYDRQPGGRNIWYLLDQEQHAVPDLTPVAGWLEHLNPHEIATGTAADRTRFAPARPNPYTRYVLTSLARCHIEFADAQYTQDTPTSVARARELYQIAANILADPALAPLPDGKREQEFDNPARVALRHRVDAQLAKLRQGRNIAGMLRDIDLPDDSRDDFLLTTPPPARPPTQYRYHTLVDRARQLATLAQQMEAEYLAALEKYDAGAFRRFEADKALELARAGVTTRTLQIDEAAAGVSLAKAQKDRATLQADRYDSFVNGGLTVHEQAMLDGYASAGKLREGIAVADGVVATLQAFESGAGNAFLSWGSSLAMAGAVAGAVAARTGLQVSLTDVETRLQADTFQASHERQVNEWTLQRDVARQDELIAGIQTEQATAHLAVAQQEHAVAQLQLDLDVSTVAFLDGQFTNVELYEWVSGVLGNAYATVLAQATAMARLAQDQLAFDRQEAPIAVVRADYWTPPAELNGAADGGAGPDRRGLTGAERLLADLVQLDQYAFQTDRRLLNITQTFSLAQRAPLEFQLFRDTGVLQFATPIAWFDADFPGHYARLIKRVRVTAAGLIPPSQGVRATLTASGISRVVVSGDTFSEVVMRRDPESVALTAPSGASGVFDLDTQSDLRLPFEAMGVATTWELRLPKAANPFDFASLADVLVTIDYTALDSYEYRRTVMAALNVGGDRTADRPLSLRRDFPDEWYALHNPTPGTRERRVTLTLDRTDFPPNLDRLTVAQTVVYLVPAKGTKPVNGVSLGLTHGSAWVDGVLVPVGGTSGESKDGVISTRRNNGGQWTAIAGHDPTGEWTLTFDAVDVVSLFDVGAVDDVLLIIGYTGTPPRWPA